MEKIDLDSIADVINKAKKGGTHFVNETGRSASAGPARAACAMLRSIIHGQSEAQSVVTIIENEYALLQPEDGLDSMSFGVPTRIGRDGVEKIYELPVDDIRERIMESASIIKKDIKHAASILRDKYSIT